MSEADALELKVDRMEKEIDQHIEHSDQVVSENASFHSDINARTAVLERMMIQMSQEMHTQTEQLYKINEKLANTQLSSSEREAAEKGEQGVFRGRVGITMAILAFLGMTVISTVVSIAVSFLLRSTN